MENDDLPVGRLLTRREMIKLFGGATLALLVGCGPDGSGGQGDGSPAATTAAEASLPGCIVRPELTEGPFFVDEMLNRSDIRTDPATDAVSEGTPLTLNFKVSQIASGACVPLAGAMVDIWHCDAAGRYSDVSANDTVGQKFLRGFQTTDASGNATFQTIYPGWYPGRTVHIHFKIRADNEAGQGQEFTSQLFFDEALTDKVYTAAPYASRGARSTQNSDDGIFQGSSGLLTLNVSEAAAGYNSTFDVALDMS